MGVPILGYRKGLIAQVTSMWPSARVVRLHVTIEIAYGPVTFQTQRTPVRFFTLEQRTRLD